MNDIIIRPLCKDDKAAVENICIATAPSALYKNEKMREYTLLMYNRYYTRVLSHSFVAVDACDNPIGYIFCAPNYDTYKKDFCTNELQDIKKLGIIKYFCARSEINFIKKYSKQFPAHLHIDILPEYQGRHIGKRLMEALLEHLKTIDVKGVMLSVAAQNKGAQAFYEKCGFQVISKGAGIIYGIRP